MPEYKVSFDETKVGHNPFIFSIIPVPDDNFEHAFQEIRKTNPHPELGQIEASFHGNSLQVLVWDRQYTVAEGDDVMDIANRVYDLQEYSPHHWRNILNANSIEDPFTLGRDFKGKQIKLPALIHHGIIQAIVKDWITKANEEIKQSS